MRVRHLLVGFAIATSTVTLSATQASANYLTDCEVSTTETSAYVRCYGVKKAKGKDKLFIVMKGICENGQGDQVEKTGKITKVMGQSAIYCITDGDWRLVDFWWERRTKR